MAKTIAIITTAKRPTRWLEGKSAVAVQFLEKHQTHTEMKKMTHGDIHIAHMHMECRQTAYSSFTNDAFDFYIW